MYNNEGDKDGGDWLARLLQDKSACRVSWDVFFCDQFVVRPLHLDGIFWVEDLHAAPLVDGVKTI